MKTPRCEAARSTRARIERVAQAVADQVEGKNGKKNCKPRPNRHPGRIDEETLGGIEHAAPRRRGRLLTKAQKRQRRFGDDGGGVMPMAIIALPRLGPRKAASAMARMRNGHARTASVMRPNNASTKPPT